MNTMKHIFTLALILFGLTASTTLNAQGPVIGPPIDGAIIEFESETMDFGTLPHKGDASGNFVVWNRGTRDLTISFCKGSCGCTVPEWPEEPVPPGGTGEVKAKFNTEGKLREQKKTITIVANTYPNETKVVVKGVVNAQ